MKEGQLDQLLLSFRTEYDKWTVLRNKSDLREMTDYRFVRERNRWNWKCG